MQRSHAFFHRRHMASGLLAACIGLSLPAAAWAQRCPTDVAYAGTFCYAGNATLGICVNGICVPNGQNASNYNTSGAGPSVGQNAPELPMDLLPFFLLTAGAIVFFMRRKIIRTP